MFLRVGLFFLLVASAFRPATAQSETPAGTFGEVANTVASSSSYYYFTEVGAPTVRVQLWGEISSPGVYDLEAGTDLRTLLTLAGGVTPLDTPTSKSTVNVRVIRQGETTTSMEAIELLEAAPILLYDGDSVYIESSAKRKFTFRDAITIVASVLGLLVAYDRVAN